MAWHEHEAALLKRCPAPSAGRAVQTTEAVDVYVARLCVGDACMAWRHHPHGPEGYCGLAGEPK